MGDPSGRAKAIFLAAIEDHEPEQWPDFLERACGGDAGLRAEVEKLLEARASLGSFHEAPRLAGTLDDPITERPGSMIGPYKLLEQIGQGGFGVVFMAEQQHPVRRKVALKVLKPGMDTRQVVARFEAERQALALMDHPNIAHILDGGETASGRPYFVMELVRGIPVTEFCDQNRLPVNERLRLFIDVCEAVQHAHQKGIIHRDLKPTNVLVTMHDDKPVAKVIDFGIAKATGPQLTEKTLFTNFAQMIGTPLYMSPEQAQMSGLDVDTRTDIYSLGVMLYELLTGTTPFDKARLKTAGYDEVRRILREEEPAKPSTRVSTLAKAGTLQSMARRSDPRRLSQLFRGELDWIVMKCLEKDRNRRYATANGLAADLRRFLADEPVHACPPSAGYRLRKFARRYRGPLRVAVVVLTALVLGTVVSVWQAVRATLAERRTQAERDRAEASSKTAREAVDGLYTKVSQDPRLKAHGLERFRKELLQKAQVFYARFVDEQSDVPSVRHDLGMAHLRLAEISRELGDLGSAENSAAKAVGILGELAAAHPDEAAYRRDLAAGHAVRGLIHNHAGNLERAVADYRQALDIQEELAAGRWDAVEYPYALAKTCSALSLLFTRMDRADDAVKMSRQAQEILGNLMAGSPKRPEYLALSAETQLNLGQKLTVNGRRSEAEPVLKGARAIYERMLRDESTALPETWKSLALCHAFLGMCYGHDPTRLETAEAETQRALGIFEKLSREHEDVVEYAYGVGRCYSELGRISDAAGQVDESLKRYDKAIVLMEAAEKKGYGAAPINIRYARIGRAGALSRRDHAQAAEAAEALARQPEMFGVDRYNLGCTFSRCAGAVDQDTKLSPSQRARLKEHYAQRAMDLLRRALDKGYTNANRASDDPDLKPLLEREDFKKLRAELDRNAGK